MKRENVMVKKRNPNEECECPICGEYLILNKKGIMTNENTGDFIYVYICEECNQAFGLDEDDTKGK